MYTSSSSPGKLCAFMYACASYAGTIDDAMIALCVQLACNKLEKNKFNLSLFERLIRNGYPHTLLLRQNRMYPDLVRLFGYHYFSEKYQGKKEILSTEVSQQTCSAEYKTPIIICFFCYRIRKCLRSLSVWGRTSFGGRMRGSMKQDRGVVNATCTRLRWSSVCVAG